MRPLLLTLFLGCGGVSEDTWDDDVRRVSCRTVRRCDPITYHRFYSDLDGCIESTELGVTEGCRFDADMARACLDAYDWSCARLGRDYDEFLETCLAVWDCAGPAGTGDTGTATVVPPL